MYRLCPTLGKVMQSVQTKRAPKKFKGYLTTNEAARLIGVSPKTLRRWDNAGKLKAVRHPINRYRLYKESELIRMAAVSRNLVLNNKPRRNTSFPEFDSEAVWVFNLDKGFIATLDKLGFTYGPGTEPPRNNMMYLSDKFLYLRFRSF